MKGFLAELEAMCECSICYDAYDDKCHVPRVLPCQHIFCTECLSKHCKRRKLKCPLCNQEHNIKNESVDKLPKDFTTCNLRELLETLSKPLCKECQNQNQVKFICKTCDVQMCTICWDNKKQSSCNLHAVEIIFPRHLQKIIQHALITLTFARYLVMKITSSNISVARNPVVCLFVPIALLNFTNIILPSP